MSELNENLSPEMVEVKVISPELKELIPANLPATDSEIILSNFSPFFPLMAEIKSEMSKINFDNPSELDCLIAGTLRKRTVKIRTGAEATKKTGKENILIVSKLYDNANGVIGNSCKLLENQLEAIEKHAEIKEAARKKLLKEERAALISPFVTGGGLDFLDEMTETQFTAYHDGLKLAHENKIKAEQEAERLAQEKLDKKNKHIEREFSVRDFGRFFDWQTSNENLTDEEFNVLVLKATNDLNEHNEEQKRIAEENAKLKAENEAKEKQLAEEKRVAEETARAEKEKSDLILKQQQEKADKEKADLEEKNRLEKEKQDAILKTEKEKSEAIKIKLRDERIATTLFMEKQGDYFYNIDFTHVRLHKDNVYVLSDENFESVLQTTKKEINRLKDEQEAREIETERLAKIEADKKAEKAPDKEKLTVWVEKFFKICLETEISGLKENASVELAKSITNRMTDFSKWAKGEIEKL